MPRALSLAEVPVHVVADLAIDNTGNAGGEARFQIIARSGDEVIAYADIHEDGTRVHLGGTYDPTAGIASTPHSSGESGPGGFPAELDAEQLVGGFTRYVLEIRSDGASLRQEAFPRYDPTDYDGIHRLDEVAAVRAENNSDLLLAGLDHVSVSGRGRTAINTLLVLASPGVGPFLRGDCNQDGRVNISDGVRILVALFEGGAEPGCLAACLTNGSDPLNLGSAVRLFTHLFLGGAPPPPPHERAGYSQSVPDFLAGCRRPTP